MSNQRVLLFDRQADQEQRKPDASAFGAQSLIGQAVDRGRLARHGPAIRLYQAVPAFGDMQIVIDEHHRPACKPRLTFGVGGAIEIAEAGRFSVEHEVRHQDSFKSNASLFPAPRHRTR